MSLTIKQKREFARLLYVEQGLNQKEAAAKVGVSPKSVNTWVEKEKWNELRSSFTITKQQELKRFYAQVSELNNAILLRPEGQRYASNKDADTLVKLSAAIKNLETDTSVADCINVIGRLINFIRVHNLPFAQQLTEFGDSFIKTLLK